jgi:predicted aspartyl protease
MKRVLLSLICVLSLPVTAATFNAVVPIHDKGAQTFYVKGKLGSLDATEFMLDTGSGYLVINQHSLAKLKENGQAGYVKDIKGILANGDEFIVPVWRIASMSINDQCTLKDVEAAVFPGKTRQILGLTALKKAAPFILSFDPPQIVFSHCMQTES